jgi:pimeloyl-ACP methyl ester carboxylesterase
MTGIDAITEADLPLPDGRTLHVYETATDRADVRLPVFWHHGTPNLGAPPRPLFAAAQRLGLRWVSFDRPGYGGSTRHVGRDMASVAADVAHAADALGIGRYAVVGHSGGASHALACAAAQPQRVVAVVSFAGIAPFDADGLDWFAGMVPSSRASLRAAAQGRAAKEAHEASGVEYDPEFTPADFAALSGDWSWLGEVAGAAMAAGNAGLIDDDLAYVSPWRCDPADIVAPALLLHGGRDGIIPSTHAQWLARRCQSAQLRLSPDDAHISILTQAPSAMQWLADVHSGRRG